MLSVARRLIGNMKAEEREGVITVYGVPTKLMSSDMKRVWGTSRLAKYMFLDVSNSKLSFYSFYAIEVLYTLETLLAESRLVVSRRALNRFVEVLRTQTWLVSLEQEPEDFLDWDALRKFKHSPLDNQEEFLSQYSLQVQRFNLNGYYLAAPPGTGKTMTALYISEMVKSDLVIIVSPPNAVHRVWRKTIDEDMIPSYEIWDSFTGGSFSSDCKHFIFHYHALGKALSMLNRTRAKRPVVLIDEGHNFNEINSQRTQNLVELCRATSPTDIVWMSGTPLKAVGYEAIPFLTTIDPLFTDKVQEGFKKLFGKQATKALDVLANRIGAVMHRVNKQEVIDHDVVERDVTVTMPESDRFTLGALKDEMVNFIGERMEYYKSNMKEFVGYYNHCLEVHSQTLTSEREREDFSLYKRYVKTISKGYEPAEMKELAMYCNKYELKKIIPSLPHPDRKKFKDTRSVIKYVDLKVRGECLGRVLGKRRSECHVKMVRHSDLPRIIDGSKKKTVIFTSFVDALEEAVTYLKEQGYRPLAVYGKTAKDFRKIVDKYEKDIDANPLVATYDSLSTAVPLVMANSVVLLNNPFRSFEREQTVSRVDRKGQDETVYVYQTLLDTGSEPNISTRSRDIMEWSKDQVDTILGTTETSKDMAGLECLHEHAPFLLKEKDMVTVGALPPSALF